MPLNSLDHAQPHPKNAPRKPPRVPMRESFWFKITSQVIILCLIAIPIGALTLPVLGHGYGFVGAAVFVVSAICLLWIFPTRSIRWRILTGAAVSAVVVIAVLHVLSTNRLIIENVSGQRIRFMILSPSDESYGFTLTNMSNGRMFQSRFHDLFYDGIWVFLENLQTAVRCRSIPLFLQSPSIAGRRSFE